MAYSYEGSIIFGILTALAASAPSVLFSIATYVLSALAIYAIARRRGLKKPWLAWIPVINIWLLGSLSDQYQYVVKGENKSKRKWLLILSILILIFIAAIVVLVIAIAGSAILGGGYYGHRDLLADVLGPAMAMLGLILPLCAVVIAFYVIRCMALYDVFKSLDPANCVLFLVLSILFHPTEPFFLFFNRSKDYGMPPRRQERVHAEEPVQEPWESEHKDYL